MAVFLAVSGNGISSVGAFSPPSPRAAAASPSVATTQKNMVATAPPMPGTANGGSSSSDAPLGWDCDDEANCVQVPACDEEVCRTSLDVRIHNEWYDLSGESALCIFLMGLLMPHTISSALFILGSAHSTYLETFPYILILFFM